MRFGVWPVLRGVARLKHTGEAGGRQSEGLVDGGKALEVLKDVLREGGLIKAALAAACGCFILAARAGWVPALENWESHAATFGLLLFGFLTLASFLSAAYRFFPPDRWIMHYVNQHRAKREVEKYLPHVTPKEREIIAYLLAKNQKTILADMDGGAAATLLSRGIITIIYQPGQQIDQENATMIVPDHLWDVLQKHREEFPYLPPDDDLPETADPWRVDWLAQ